MTSKSIKPPEMSEADILQLISKTGIDKKSK